jgi:hypothetical protein
MHSHILDPEQIGLLRTGKLKQGYSITRLIRSEAWTRLGIESDNLLRPQICYGPIELGADAVYYENLSRE